DRPSHRGGDRYRGRVSKKDMERAIAARKESEPAPQPAALSTGHRPLADGDEVVPITRMRRTIAERMLHSTRTVPHAWTMVEVDVTSLVAWRERIKEDFRRREGFNLTYLAFVVK